jgi:hypothetical protein
LGKGGNLRFGYELGVPQAFFTPEVGLGYLDFPGSDSGNHVALTSPFAGARLGIGAPLRFYVDAHAGGAHRSYGSVGGATPASGWSPYFDGGAGLGLKFIYLELGVHGGLGISPATKSTPDLRWFTVGLNLTISAPWS